MTDNDEPNPIPSAKPRKRRGGYFVPYVPTPEEIAAECAKIRAGLDRAEHRRRIAGVTE